MKIIVDEKGTEAAATVMVMNCMYKSMKRHSITIKIDKPFYFMISDDEKVPMFFGKITNPQYHIFFFLFKSSERLNMKSIQVNHQNFNYNISKSSYLSICFHFNTVFFIHITKMNINLILLFPFYHERHFRKKY